MWARARAGPSLLLSRCPLRCACSYQFSQDKHIEGRRTERSLPRHAVKKRDTQLPQNRLGEKQNGLQGYYTVGPLSREGKVDGVNF